MFKTSTYPEILCIFDCQLYCSLTHCFFSLVFVFVLVGTFLSSFDLDSWYFCLFLFYSKHQNNLAELETIQNNFEQFLTILNNFEQFKTIKNHTKQFKAIPTIQCQMDWSKMDKKGHKIVKSTTRQQLQSGFIPFWLSSAQLKYTHVW